MHSNGVMIIIDDPCIYRSMGVCVGAAGRNDAVVRQVAKREEGAFIRSSVYRGLQPPPVE